MIVLELVSSIGLLATLRGGIGYAVAAPKCREEADAWADGYEQGREDERREHDA